MGIDLVAKEKETGEFWAVQCKCYDKNHPISKGDLDTFFSLSGKKPFEKRIFVTTSTKWGKNAKATIDGQSKNCTLIDLTKLEKAEFDWTETSVKRRAQKEIRPHQKKALESVKHYFSEGHERGKLIMACGTGKTFTSLRIVEKLTPKTGRVLFLAPSISLISQTLREYAYERKDDQRYLVICSDKKSGKDSEGEDVLDLQIPPTTKVKEIVEVLRKRSSKRTIVFCTYQSLSQIMKAQTQKVPQFDLIVCDEAHRTTGVDGKSFTLVHDREKIKAHRRLYMTATPRIYTENIKAKAEKCNVVVPLHG